MTQKSREEQTKDELAKYEDRKTLLRHIDNLIKFDVGEKVFYFDMWSDKIEIPKVGEIEGIYINHSYGDGSDPYAITFLLKQEEGKEVKDVWSRKIDQKNCRKYDEKVAKFVNEYHDFFDRMKKSE